MSLQIMNLSPGKNRSRIKSSLKHLFQHLKTSWCRLRVRHKGSEVTHRGESFVACEHGIVHRKVNNLRFHAMLAGAISISKLEGSVAHLAPITLMFGFIREDLIAPSLDSSLYAASLFNSSHYPSRRVLPKPLKYSSDGIITEQCLNCYLHLINR